MTDKEEQLRDIQKVLIANYLKKKADEIADNTKKDDKVKNPLRKLNAVIDSYGLDNRLDS